MKSTRGSLAVLARGLAVAVISSVIASFAVPMLNDAAPRPGAAPMSGRRAAGDSRDVALFEQVLATIEREYVDQPDRSRLVDTALRAMASSLDPNSDYLDAAELDDSDTVEAGSYCGIGVEVSTVGARVEIVSVMGDSPAASAGLQPGDSIVAVGRRTVGAGAERMTHLLRGAPGTKVSLVLRSRGSNVLKAYALRRRCLPIRTVHAALLARGYGYVRISSFNDTTSAELKQAIAALDRTNGSRIGGLVLDLRDNGGGVFEAGAAVADAFLDSGVIVTAYGRAPDSRLHADATPGDLLRGAPMAVLVNGNSASASEIVAGALRDHARAILVGSRTYGKGTVQTIIPLARGAIKLTTARFFSPSGASIQGRGFVPDVLIDDAAHPRDSSVPDAEPSERDPEVRVALDVVMHAAPVTEAFTAPPAGAR